MLATIVWLKAQFMTRGNLPEWYPCEKSDSIRFQRRKRCADKTKDISGGRIVRDGIFVFIGFCDENRRFL